MHLSTQAIWEAEMGGLHFQANPGKKVHRNPISMEKSWVCWHTPVYPGMVSSLKKEISVQAGLGKK
jgi:hypothetical protein